MLILVSKPALLSLAILFNHSWVFVAREPLASQFWSFSCLSVKRNFI